MSFNSALTAGNYTSLRGSASVSPSHSATLYVSVCPNNNVYTARVNQSTFAASFAQVTYDGGSGTLANVRVGMTVLVSHTNDRMAAHFSGRIRKAPTGSIFYINETSAPFADNDYIFVIDDYRIWDKLARFVDPTLYPDYEVAFRQLLPLIYGLKSAYVVATDGSDGTFSFAPSTIAATSGAAISTYLWEVEDGTITVGSSSTQNITATFPPGFRWIHLTVTDSGSRQSTRHIPIWVHDSDNQPVPLEIGDFEWNASIDEGFSASLPTFSGVDAILDNTLIVAWVDGERYNTVATNIVDNIVMVGRFRNEKSTTTYDEFSQQDATTRFDIEGPLQTLGRLEVNPVEILSQLSPTAFCEIKDCTPWRETHLILSEFSTFHELHSLAFDDTSNTFADRGVTVPLGSLLNGVNVDLYSINARLQMNGAGQSEAVRDAVMLPTASRTSLVTVANWTTADILDIDYEHDEVNVIGRSLASGGAYNTSSGHITTTNSLAPGVAQDYPEGSTTLDRQVLAANNNEAAAASELNIRNGHWLALSQGFDTLIVTHLDGYWWLTPSQNQWYTFTLDGSETARGIVLTTSTRWILAEVRGTYNLVSGTFEIQATYHKETSGAAGQTIVYPPQNVTPFTLPSLPPIPAFPPFDIGDFFLPDDITADIVPPTLFGTLTPTVKHDGNMVLVWTESSAWICNDFVSQLRPTWIEITPTLETGESIVAARFIPGNTPGAVILTNLSEGSSTIYDFTASDGGFTAQTVAGWTGTAGVYSAGVGWLSTSIERIANPSEHASVIVIYKNLGAPVTARVVTMLYDMTVGTWDVPEDPSSIVMDATTVFGDPETTSGTNKTLSAIGSYTFSEVTLNSAASRLIGTADGLVVIKKLTIIEGGNARVWRTPNVFDKTAWIAGAEADTACDILRIGETFDDLFLVDQISNVVYYSSDQGATVSSAISIGAAPATVGGFDTGRLGTVTIGAADGLARIATTQGGAYSDYATLPTDNVATAVFIPRYSFLGANNGIGVSAPDFLFASETPASGTGNTLWTVTVGGTVFGNISPSDGGNKGIAISPNCLNIPWYSTAYLDILALLSFNGTKKLAVSTDGGTSWILSGALSANANYITTRRSDTLRRQVFLTNGSSLAYCSSYRSNPPVLAARVGPDAGTLLGIDVLP